MNKLPVTLEELHRSENHLAALLLRVSDRNKQEHEVFYLARDLARWSQEHVRRLAEVGRDYGLELDEKAKDDNTVLEMLQQKGAELVGRHHEASLLQLRDLREIHRHAAGVSLDWEVLAQTAQALKDRELLGLTKECHPETLRQMRWANAMVKESSAQVMVT